MNSNSQRNLQSAQERHPRLRTSDSTRTFSTLWKTLRFDYKQMTWYPLLFGNRNQKSTATESKQTE